MAAPHILLKGVIIMFECTSFKHFSRLLLTKKPHAEATIKGSAAHPHIRGTARLYQTKEGVLLAVNVKGLPRHPGPCASRIFGFHIHEGAACTGNAEDPFANAGMHYNPKGCGHPEHAGDLPPLFGNQGQAFMAVLTDRFTVKEVLGRALIVHDAPDDFTSQPSGNSGNKIACGIIRAAI